MMRKLDEMKSDEERDGGPRGIGECPVRAENSNRGRDS